MQSHDVFRDVMARLEACHATLGENLVQFAGALKAAELGVATTQVLGAAQALLAIDMAKRGDARAALSACFLTNADDRPVFDALFDQFWRLSREDDEPSPPRPQPPRLAGGETRLGVSELVDSAYARGEGAKTASGDMPPQSYSSDEALAQKDFALFRDDELRDARRHLRRLAPKLASARTRRQRPARSGSGVDLRRSLRHAARHGGEVLRLSHRRKKIRRLNVVLLCDVSGSMDVYSRFLVQFLYGLQHELRGVSTFVFSTRLFEVTPMLKARSFDEALVKVSKDVHGWSGGTRIGACLAEFNRRHARQRVGRRTVVVVISDGWDRGDAAELGREMQALKRRCFRTIWLNPLLGAPDYRPVAQGMAAALPSIDGFLPVHNLASLARVGRTLVRLSNG